MPDTEAPIEIEIEFVFDFICPWSYICKRRLYRAIRVCTNMHTNVSFKVKWRPYILDETLPSGNRITTRQRFVNQMGAQAAGEFTDRINRAAKDEGLVVHLDGISGRTTILHGLMLKLAEMGLETEFLDKVFQAYFVDQQDICDVYAVANIIEQMKLDEDELKKSDYGIAYKSQLLKLLDENGELGVQGTPFFIFDRTFAMSGAQPVDKLMFIFEQLVERAKRPASVSQSTGEDGKGGQDKLTEGPSLDTATVASATGTTPPSRSPATTSPAAPRYFTPSS